YMKISYSAPGKIILSGEHSVVYTKPALVTAVDLILTATISDGETSVKDQKLHDAVISIDHIVKEYLDKEKLKFEARPFVYSYTSQIPEGRGMGSSAAFCVATVAALLHFYTGKEHTKETINSLAYKAEHHFHGMPSGVDVSASCFGGLVYYRKEFEFLKYISALNFKIPKNIQDSLILIDTGRPTESTSEMVQLVGKRYNAMPLEMEKTLIGIEKVTKKMVVSLVKEDLHMFAECIEENQKLLVEFGIVSDSAQEIVTTISPAGVGKVTGAGGAQSGSGLLLFLIRDSKIFNTLKEKHNLKTIPFKQNFEGVKQGY
ncbi:mevalonate kinase, partial [Candidatus Woesebacteria bacterium]|nr:mevalonate kinase [Candidatus Woesebacteria bacterium]